MNLGLVGVGGAGGRIVGEILRAEKRTGLSLTNSNVLCFDTDREDLDALSSVPKDRRIPVGETVDRVARGPVDGDAELALEVARTDDFEIQRSFDVMPIERLDGLVVIAGLAGGTGGGTGAAILEMCQDLFDPPVYAVGILPRDVEGTHAAMTASRALQSYVRLADNFIAFDNDSWIEGAEDQSDYSAANASLAERLVRFLAVGDFGGVLAERRADRTDIMRTLNIGGVTTIGMASIPVYPGWRRFVRWFPSVDPSLRDGTNPAYRVKDLVREAATGDLTLPCTVGSAERALVILSGPPSVLSRRGFESARYWLEQEAETVEVIAGDEPRPRSRYLRALVVLSNVTDVPRIDAMHAQALQDPPNQDQ